MTDMGNITRFAFVLAIAAMVVGLSGCDQLLQILSDDQMADSDVPQFTETQWRHYGWRCFAAYRKVYRTLRSARGQRSGIGD